MNPTTFRLFLLWLLLGCSANANTDEESETCTLTDAEKKILSDTEKLLAAHGKAFVVFNTDSTMPLCLTEKHQTLAKSLNDRIESEEDLEKLRRSRQQFIDSVELKLTAEFDEEPGNDDEKFGGGINLKFYTFALDKLRFGGVLPDRVDIQADIEVETDRSFLANERSKTDRLEIFPVQLTYDLKTIGTKPFFRIGHSWSETTQRDLAAGTTETESRNESSWKVGLEFELDGFPLSAEVAQTWRFDQFLSDKTSDSFELTMKYEF